MLISQVNINKHIVAFHDKFAIGLSCIILFFVGAPLGALIRKGGIGLPLVIAILIFLTYHFISIFAKNSSEDGSMNPILASWLSSLILLPFSIYLTNRATKDRALLDFDSILISVKKLFYNKLQINKRKDHNNN
jgi:lipopolysaccharide export system permease protein